MDADPAIRDSQIRPRGIQISHLNKDQMEREGTLPRELPLTEEATNIMEQYNNSLSEWH
jgi:hypothetical protein